MKISAEMLSTLATSILTHAGGDPVKAAKVAKRLVSADFLTIIEDMAKEGLSEVRRIGGIKGSDDYDY